MSRVFFTSDLHFFHENIRKFCPASRGQWNSKEEMNEGLIKAWNDRVGQDDIVYNFGDFCFSPNYDALKNLFERLNGQQHFMFGNHDKSMKTHIGRLKSDGILGSKIIDVKDYTAENIEGQAIRMMHFPMAVWERNHHGSWNLYGHCHGSYKAIGKQLDVGFDSNDFGEIPWQERGPWSFDQIKRVLDKREIVVQDHHDNKRNVD